MSSQQTAADGRITIFEDEELLHDLQPSFLTVMTLLDWIATLFTLGIWLIIPFLRWRNTRYVITDQRLIDMQGSLTGSTTDETNFDSVAGDVTTEQGSLEGLVNRTIKFELEKVRSQTATEREFGDQAGSERDMAVTREQVELEGIGDYQEVSNSIRRLANQ